MRLALGLVWLFVALVPIHAQSSFSDKHPEEKSAPVDLALQKQNTLNLLPTALVNTTKP